MVALIVDVTAISATITFADILETTTYSSFESEVVKTVGNIHENELTNVVGMEMI